MTREEAIELLDNLIGMVEDNQNSDYDTALKMAIKALEQDTVSFDFELYQAGLMDMPKGVTNGDMIKAVFPSSEVRETMDDLVHYTLDGYVGAYTPKDWWNAPYKRESE
jgi:hypothetical protein